MAAVAGLAKFGHGESEVGGLVGVGVTRASDMEAGRGGAVRCRDGDGSKWGGVVWVGGC